eukprot:TRINITY_DN67973_c0_g1_i1.p1 TRINITY_DN67973_c0_g1~~TRINITY_DN67973_c0_g1_i1.p1  ORF type:complete len:358 (-),score=90.79 TRINITY_DN67973_c0_g1_i1:6-1079(-)
MKKRMNALASSTNKKKRSWRDDDEEESAPGGGGALPVSDSDVEVVKKTDKGDTPVVAKGAGMPNPVVWMEISVAGTPRGRLHFELFRDAAPTAADNFRKLCAGIDEDGKMVSYKGVEFDRIFPGRLLEGGDVEGSLDIPAIEREGILRHSKAGLLTMSPGSPSYGDSRFQLTLGATPDLDGKQVVFGQLLGSPGSALHALHWVEAVGAASGSPREAVVIEACGESTAEESEALLGAMVMAAQVDRTAESEQDRYGRTGHTHGKLEDSITDDNVAEVVELTDELLEHLEWACKKAKSASEKDRKARELEDGVKSLIGVLKKVEFKAGEVKGFDNKLGRSAKGQLSRAKELEESLVRLY